MLDPDAMPGPFGLAEDLGALDAPCHTHRRAQLLYATAGAMRLRAGGRLVVLPCDRAAWIPGGTPHRVLRGKSGVGQSRAQACDPGREEIGDLGRESIARRGHSEGAE